jgi:hypothetical protein
VREDDVAAFGALGLDHGGEAGETAAALAVGHQLVRHEIDVVDQNEGDARRCCGRLGSGDADRGERDQQEAGGNAAGDEVHGALCHVRSAA